ncbi:MAG TPA: hypothetical protein VD927_16535 [Chryseosolibacter sp.]|nr:hypothetical protein [Chryseosolibacter sp.]
MDNQYDEVQNISGPETGDTDEHHYRSRHSPNTTSHETGILSMACASASSERLNPFFIKMQKVKT